VLINETMAKQFWPQSDPVGELITMGILMGPEFVEPPRQIIGVVGDVRDIGLNSSPEPTMYVPIPQISDGLIAILSHRWSVTWAVRTKVAPYSLSANIQRELRAASGGLPLAHIRTMEQVAKESTARNEFNMTLLSIFAGIALLLAAIGIYGVMAYSVQQRTQEIGIRMALGAQPGDVLRMVLRHGLLLCLVGIAVGISGAFAVIHLMKSLIFGVSPTDPVTFVSVSILLAGVAFFACWIPARRASRVDPMVALRHE
jgi:predicted permease